MAAARLSLYRSRTYGGWCRTRVVCFLALIVYRVMRQRLKLAKSDLSPERALAELRKIQRHRVRINKAEPISGISTINDSQAEVLETLKIRKPTQDAQLTLL